MKILVTGANGYLGQGIVRKLIDEGNIVIATGRTTENVDRRAIRKDADLFLIEDPYSYFEEPDIVLHLAWKNGFVHYADSHIDDLPKHYNFIKKMAKSNINKIAVMGSMHEIGFYEGCINETTPCMPITPYGISKNALRELTKMLCLKNNKVFQWLRGYYIVGNSKYGSSIFSKITAAAEKDERKFPFTMGQNQFDFIDYDDFCNQVSLAICQDQINGIIEICSGKPEKLSERVERFIEENKYNIKLDYGAFPDRPYDSKAVWGNSYKIENIIKRRKENGNDKNNIVC